MAVRYLHHRPSPMLAHKVLGGRLKLCCRLCVDIFLLTLGRFTCGHPNAKRAARALGKKKDPSRQSTNSLPLPLQDEATKTLLFQDHLELGVDSNSSGKDPVRECM